MSKKIVDAKGELCPKPLIMTKKALAAISLGEELVIVVDNETAKENIETFLKDNNYSPTVTKENKNFFIHINKSSEDLINNDALSYCKIPNQQTEHKKLTIVISKDYMGEGDQDLTKLLIQGFVNTIKEISPRPQNIIFYASGIFLTLSSSPVLKALKELEALSINILVCGTCLDFYQKKEQLRVGKISNMYTILETMSASDKVIGPY